MDAPHLFLLLLFLILPCNAYLLSSPSPTPAPPCPQVLPRIVGGHSPPTLVPYMAALYDSYGFFVCTGTMVSDRWIITAAHCRVAVDWFVRIAGDTAAAGTRRNISFVANHPYYDSHTAQRDIAVVQLSLPVGQWAKFAAVNWNFSLPQPHSYAKAVGYGVTFEGQPITGRVENLLAVDVPVVTLDQCTQLYQAANVPITKQMICAGRQGCDSCQGDSGGALMQFDVTGRAVLVGVVSFGIGCARGEYPGVYTMISKMKWWLEQVGCVFDGGVGVQVLV